MRNGFQVKILLSSPNENNFNGVEIFEQNTKDRLWQSTRASHVCQEMNVKYLHSIKHVHQCQSPQDMQSRSQLSPPPFPAVPAKPIFSLISVARAMVEKSSPYHSSSVGFKTKRERGQESFSFPVKSRGQARSPLWSEPNLIGGVEVGLYLYISL